MTTYLVSDQFTSPFELMPKDKCVQGQCRFKLYGWAELKLWNINKTIYPNENIQFWLINNNVVEKISKTMFVCFFKCSNSIDFVGCTQIAVYTHKFTIYHFCRNLNFFGTLQRCILSENLISKLISRAVWKLVFKLETNQLETLFENTNENC